MPDTTRLIVFLERTHIAECFTYQLWKQELRREIKEGFDIPRQQMLDLPDETKPLLAAQLQY